MPYRAKSKVLLNRKTRKREETDRKIHKQGELKHWLEVENPRIVHLPYGTYNHRFLPQFDVISGQPWMAYYDRVLSIWPKKTSWLIGGRQIQYKELRYTLEQYRLIAWACWRMENGWSPREVFQIMVHPENELRWTVLPGQTPLTSRKVHAWRRFRRNMMTRGLMWP